MNRRYVGIPAAGAPIFAATPQGFRKEIRERYTVPAGVIHTIGTQYFPSVEIIRTWPSGWTPESRDEDKELCQRLGIVLGPPVPPVPTNPFKDKRS